MKTLSEQKQCLRAKLKNYRANMGRTRREAADRAIRERLLSLPLLQRAKTIFCFISTDFEVDTRQLIDILLKNKKNLAVPKIIDGSRMAAIEFPGWQSLCEGTLGIPAPRSQIPMSDRFDITLTPGLGFSENGDRLGYGRGYYDEWFKLNNSGIKIALAYDSQICNDIPSNDRDIKVDMILTENRIIRVSTPSP